MSIGVFDRGQDVQTLPMYSVDYETAYDLVNVMRAARWVNNRRKNIQMLVEMGMKQIRGQSCSVNERVMFDFACGKPYAVAIVERWAFQV